MSDLIICEKEKLIEIADAIRAKTGSSEHIGFPSEFAPAIEGIPAGGVGQVTFTTRFDFPWAV